MGFKISIPKITTMKQKSRRKKEKKDDKKEAFDIQG